MRIFIPTCGRKDAQATARSLFYDQICQDWDIKFVVNERERSEWMAGSVMVVPDNFRIPEIRNAILHSPGDPHQLVIDDDLTFFKRYDGVRLRKCELIDIIDMLARVESLLNEGYAHGGISAREGNNNEPNDVAYNTRVIRCNFANSEICSKQPFDYRHVRGMEDFHFTLSMLELGFENAVLFEFAQNQPQSHAPGGCSEYRTQQSQKDDAYRLQELHPDFVTVVEKESQSWGQSFGPRYDCRMKWKAALGTKGDQRV